jgi:hypothetical protein
LRWGEGSTFASIVLRLNNRGRRGERRKNRDCHSGRLDTRRFDARALNGKRPGTCHRRRGHQEGAPILRILRVTRVLLHVVSSFDLVGLLSVLWVVLEHPRLTATLINVRSRRIAVVRWRRPARGSGHAAGLMRLE